MWWHRKPWAALRWWFPAACCLVGGVVLVGRAVGRGWVGCICLWFGPAPSAPSLLTRCFSTRVWFAGGTHLPWRLGLGMLAYRLLPLAPVLRLALACLFDRQDECSALVSNIGLAAR